MSTGASGTGAWTVDLAGLRSAGPHVRGSVQNLYRVERGGGHYLVADATDSGSAFDVGTFFTVPGSGRSRTELRHAVFRRLATPASWRHLTMPDLVACYGADEAARQWDGSRLERLRSEGAATHHVGIVDEQTREVTDASVVGAAVVVREYPVIKPEHFAHRGRPAWDYHRYQMAASKVLALEHIFRLGSPAGSSIVERYARALDRGGEDAAAAVAESAGVSGPITAWGRFDTMVYDCSTKYEDHDRYLDWQEAVHVSGVEHSTFLSVIDLLGLCTVHVSVVFASLGLVLWDIKWEAAIDGDAVVVVDTVDHDSVRITADRTVDGRRCHFQFNKQAIRDYFRILHPEWVSALDHAKGRAEEDDGARTFRQIYDDGVRSGEYPPIPELDPELAAIQAEKYDVVAAGASGRAIPDQVAGRIAAVVDGEIGFYAARGRRDAFLAHIGEG
ncbi:MAG: phosphoribosylaminoimidazolesuccinocarboxamide synthase [Acidimicrobiales bacterium]